MDGGEGGLRTRRRSPGVGQGGKAGKEPGAADAAGEHLIEEKAGEKRREVWTEHLSTRVGESLAGDRAGKQPGAVDAVSED